MAESPVVEGGDLFAGDLDGAVTFEQLTALAEEYEIRLAFTAGDWGVPDGWRGRSGRASLDLAFAEISGVGYPWMGLKDADLVGLLEPEGEAWARPPLDFPEGHDPTGGSWRTDAGDRYDSWLAEHPEGH